MCCRIDDSHSGESPASRIITLPGPLRDLVVAIPVFSSELAPVPGSHYLTMAFLCILSIWYGHTDEEQRFLYFHMLVSVDLAEHPLVLCLKRRFAGRFNTSVIDVKKTPPEMVNGSLFKTDPRRAHYVETAHPKFEALSFALLCAAFPHRAEHWKKEGGVLAAGADADSFYVRIPERNPSAHAHLTLFDAVGTLCDAGGRYKLLSFAKHVRHGDDPRNVQLPAHGHALSPKVYQLAGIVLSQKTSGGYTCQQIKRIPNDIGVIVPVPDTEFFAAHLTPSDGLYRVGQDVLAGKHPIPGGMLFAPGDGDPLAAVACAAGVPVGVMHPAFCDRSRGYPGAFRDANMISFNGKYKITTHVMPMCEVYLPYRLHLQCLAHIPEYADHAVEVLAQPAPPAPTLPE